MAAPQEVLDVNMEVQPSNYIVPNQELEIFQGLPDFSIRNGDPSDVVPFVVRPTIGAGYKWVPIQGLPPSKAIERTDLFIKSAIAQLTLHPPPDFTEERIRKAGIALGVARAVTTSKYDVTPSDLIPGEARASMLHYSTSPTGAVSVAVAAGVPEAARAILTTDFAPTEQEAGPIGIMMTSAVGIAPLQGFSLIMTGHHYLSEGNNPSRKAFQVLESQVWKGSSYTEWFTGDMVNVRDYLWHKSCHPIKVNLKQQWASDPAVATALRTTGVGAAASRLPAAEPELRAAQSYLTLLQTVRPYFETTGGSVDFGILSRAIDTVKLFPALYRTAPAAQVQAVQLPAGIPAGITDRMKALEYLSLVMQRNSDAVATAFGFYCTLSERTANTGGEAVVDTLRNSYALRKLRTQSVASYTMGAEFYGDYASAKSAMRGRGEYETPNVSIRM